MSGTDKTSCISHKQNSRFFVMYEDFLDVAKVSEHQYKLAAFWRVLETKTNDQMTYNEKLVENARTLGLPTPEATLWIEISYSEFVRRSMGLYKSSSFQLAAAESERLGFSKSRVEKRHIDPRNPESPMEDYKEYLFFTNVMQSVLNGGAYPTPIEINSPLLKAQKERKAKRAIENNTPPIENNTGTPIEINSPPIENNRLKNNSNNKDTKNTEIEEREKANASDAIASAHSFPQNEEVTSENIQPTLSQNAHPSMHALLQGGANTHPSSDNMTPPTTSVAITPRFKGENTAASIQDESSTSHAATTPVENSEETHDKAPQSEIVSNGTPVTSEAAQSQNELFPDAEVSAASGAIVPEVEKVSAAKGDKPKPTRKPRAKKNVFTIPEELRERVNKVYAKFDALRQKVTSDPEERYIRNEESDRAICTLFQAKAPTEERLEKVYMAMWNEPRNQRTGYFAREHMTITTVCKKYADQSMVYSAQDNQSKGVVSFSAGGYTYKPEEMPVRELEFVGPSNRKRRGA